MRILIANKTDKLIEGLSQVAAFTGHKAVVWNPNRPFHIVYNEFKPEIIISNFVNEEMIHVLSKHPETQCAFKCSQEDYSKLAAKLFNAVHIKCDYAANFFHGHYPRTKEKKFIACANTAKTEQSEKIFGGFLDHKAEVPLKLFSDENWPGEYYCGPISDNDFAVISNLSWFTIHSGPLSQSVYDAILCRSLVITDNDELPIVPIVTSYKEIVEEIKRLNQHPKEYDLIVEQSYKYIVGNHTYFHRFDEVMSGLGYESNTVEKIKELK
jgi:hypothetical protein